MGETPPTPRLQTLFPGQGQVNRIQKGRQQAARLERGKDSSEERKTLSFVRQELGSVRKGRFHKGRWVEEVQRCVRPAMHHRASACGARTQAGAPRAGCCPLGVQDLFTGVSHTLRRLTLLHMAERTVAKYKPWLCALVKVNSSKGSVAFFSSFVGTIIRIICSCLV